MFTIRGQILKGDNEKKNLMLRIDVDDYNKIITECDSLHHVFKTPQQPIYPCWKYGDEAKDLKFYCKVLLSKNRKESYETLVQNSSIRTWRVAAVPYSIDNSNTGTCNGISLYWQGEYTAPKKFRTKQEKQIPLSPRPNQLEHEL